MKEQVKSKERVSRHGEVFTKDKEVNEMLNMVKQETERIDSRFLDPACGDGNFLCEILRRKLIVVKNKYKALASDYERYSVVAVSSIYGIDILEDNIYECRKRIYELWEREYRESINTDVENEFKESIKFILKRNILCGNTLSMRTINGQPIIFSQWDLVMGNKIKQRDYRMDEITEGSQSGQITLNMYKNSWQYNTDTGVMIPNPIREFPAVDFRRLVINEYVIV